MRFFPVEDLELFKKKHQNLDCFDLLTPLLDLNLPSNEVTNMFIAFVTKLLLLNLVNKDISSKIESYTAHSI
jgi:hypothetical protein